MKKTITILLALVMLFSLAACGGKKEIEQNASEEGQTEIGEARLTTEQLVKQSTTVTRGQVYKELQENMARAKETYENNYYTMWLCVGSIGGDYFEDEYSFCRFKVYLDENDLLKTNTNTVIQIVGRITSIQMDGDFYVIAIEDARFITDVYEVNDVYVYTLGNQNKDFTWASIEDENFNYLKISFDTQKDIPVSITAKGKITKTDSLGGYEMTPDDISIITTPQK